MKGGGALQGSEYMCYCIVFIEAIQSRCAMLRYSRLSDAQILERLLEVCDKEEVCLCISR